ncbi:hypothetical protein KDV41_21460, partial [Providencia stuartii]|uniref:hypothetical protein n=1 Tax=Providencia stuartii TaxID=588 RepID=UPI0033210537
LWDRNGREEYWLTAYAADFLNRANQRGYTVPKEALTNANSRLPLVQLGIALNLMGDKTRGDNVIADGLKKQRARYSYSGDYGS